MIDASLNIRRMAALDSEALADTFAAWHKPLSQFENYYLEQMLEKRLVLVALLGEKIIGYNTLIWESPYTHFWRRRIPEIVDLNVWPTYQRQGVGKALIARCEMEAHAHGYMYVGISVVQTSDYANAERLYRALFYVPDGFGVTHEDNELHLIKKLG